MPAVDIQFDFHELHDRAVALGASSDQVPFALARTMNDAMQSTREHIIGVMWPRSVTARNRSFLKAALTTKGSRARKTLLEVELYDRLHRGHLQLHARGGTKRAKAGNLAIGTRNVRRTSKGVVDSDKPRSFGTFKRGDAIFKKTGGKSLRLMYVLKPSAFQKPDVPFYETFAQQMNLGLRRHLPLNVMKAMQTRR